MKRPPSARHTPGSGGAATEPVDILGEREGDELERLGHRRIDVDHIDEVIRGGPEAQGHRRLVDHFPGVHPKHRDPHDPARRTIQHHLDHTARVADGPGPWYDAQRNRVAVAFDPGGHGLFVGHAYDGDLGVGEDGARDDGVIDLAQRLSVKGVVGGDLAVVRYVRRRHIVLVFRLYHNTSG